MPHGWLLHFAGCTLGAIGAAADAAAGTSKTWLIAMASTSALHGGTEAVPVDVLGKDVGYLEKVPMDALGYVLGGAAGVLAYVLEDCGFETLCHQHHLPRVMSTP